MKTAVSLILILFATTAFAQNKLRLGIGLGSVANKSYYVSGNETASALFTNHDLGAGLISFIANKEIGKRFSIQGSLSFTEIGFHYSLSKNYSLLNPESKFNNVKAANCIGTIPVLFNIHSNLNCRNWRWVAGIGPELLYSFEDFNATVEGSDNKEDVVNSSMSQKAMIPAFTAFNLIWQVSREKQLKKGGLFRIGIVASHGFSELGFSTVEYNVDGSAYSHSFSTKGSYAGLNINWLFRPVNKKGTLENKL